MLDLSEEKIKEICEAYIADQERSDAHYDRWCDIISKMSIERKCDILNKIKEKYNSDAYKERWYSRNIEPPEMLYWYAFEYAQRYGTEYDYDLDYFESARYIVDDKFIVSRFDGQGSFIDIRPITEEILKDLKDPSPDRRIIRKYLEEGMQLYNENYDIKDILKYVLTNAVNEATAL